MTHIDDIDDPKWHDIFDRDKKIKELNLQLDYVRDALGWGANEDAWPPGLTIGESVARIVTRLEDAKIAIENAPCEVARPGEMTYECRVDRLCRVCVWRNEALIQWEAHAPG